MNKRKKKGWKEMKTFSDTSGEHYNIPIFEVQVFKKKKEKLLEKMFDMIIVKNLPNMRKKIITQDQEVQSLIQDKSQKAHASMHSNHTKENLNTQK